MPFSSFSFPTTLAALATLGACGSNTQEAAHVPQAANAAAAIARVIFRCTLAQDGTSYEVLEKGGLVSLNGTQFRDLPVTRYRSEDGTRSTYIFEGAQQIDGVPHNLALSFGAGSTPDLVSSDGDEFACRFKATVNTAALDFLASRAETRVVKAILARESALGLCNKGQEKGPGYGTSLGAASLGNGQWLVPISCFTGAYQGMYQMVAWNDSNSQATLLKFETFDPVTRKVSLATENIGMPTFSLLKGTWTNFSKSRGIGDCGSYATYGSRVGDVLPLVELRIKDACDGIFVEPSRWPVVFKR